MSNKIEFWRLQKTAKLTNKQAAEYLCVNSRSIDRWRVDKPPAPRMAILSLKLYIKELDDEKHSGLGK